MTHEQFLSIESLRRSYEDNLKEYVDWDSKNICTFDLYESNNDFDKNILLITTTIAGEHESMAGVLTQRQKILIMPDGNTIHLSSPEQEIAINNYINTLKKIN